MSDFRLVSPPVLAGAKILRDEHLRRDVGRHQLGWAAARVVVVDAEGRSPVEWTAAPAAPGASGAPQPGTAQSGPRLRTVAARDLAAAPPPDAVLLGEAESLTYWAVRGAPDEAAADGPSQWLNLYSVGAELPAFEAAVMAAAVALLSWHDNARFCARDGSPTHPRNAGWARVCEAGQHEEYPRTDPAVICLVHDGADRVLLARQRTWPADRFSVLAGFVEAGESLEACVAREIAEEVGVDVSGISYLGSQAWPFPRSLMIGFHAVADPRQPIRLDDKEIAEARWVHRHDLDGALARNDWAAATDADRGQLLLPGRLSIARTMIDSWAAAVTSRH
ncbi:NADH pyrophosphatase [Parafrankia colletiae]|uniref:NAD(+) diphosphatase n=1 Tax=Parafrankia colletiae TaxID=573497 RepID=A0A1S1QXI9_9ACTN|nr:NAD(+) diphosphatase [Parafrankia colletiae]MCK9898618.1 NAD(+) diphosphatase [Frankia sp. Cpl3]OHV39413.1 NADH pyrophosphatase [Parafrankia colletiae]